MRSAQALLPRMNAGAPTKREKPQRSAAGFYLSTPFSSTGIHSCLCQRATPARSKNAFFCFLVSHTRSHCQLGAQAGMPVLPEKQKPRCVSTGACCLRRDCVANRILVRSSGFEPPRYCYRQPLKLVRLPVPPRPLVPMQLTSFEVRLFARLRLSAGFAVASISALRQYQCCVNIRAWFSGKFT